MNATLDIPFTALNASRNCTAFGLWHNEALLKETIVTVANFLRSAITIEVPRIGVKRRFDGPVGEFWDEYCRDAQ